MWLIMYENENRKKEKKNMYKFNLLHNGINIFDRNFHHDFHFQGNVLLMNNI